MKRNRVDRVRISNLQNVIDELNNLGWTLMGPAQAISYAGSDSYALLTFEREDTPTGTLGLQ